MAASVLVVDDDLSIRRMLERTLTADGHDVHTAGDGGAALAAIERSAPDLLVLDLSMPGLDGLAVCRRLRARRLALPILVRPYRRAHAARGAAAGAPAPRVRGRRQPRASAARRLGRRGVGNAQRRRPGDRLAAAQARGAAGDPHRARRGLLARAMSVLRPRTLRGRVALATALATLVALGALALTIGFLIDRELNASLDRSLRQRADYVATLAATTPALVADATALDGPPASADLSVQVVDRRGRIVARSPALGARVLPIAAARAAIVSKTGHFGHVDLGEDHLRIFALPLAQSAGGGAVLVAASTAELERTVHRVHVLLAIATFVTAALAAAAATALTRRATRPLARLAASAHEIERTSDVSRRLPVDDGPQEVAGLAVTLNAMLGALERARANERRFVDDASHELRTPVTALRGNVDFVARHGLDDAVLADLVHDSERLSRLLDDLLALAREDAAAAPVERVDLSELAADATAGDPLVDLDVNGAAPVRGDRLSLERVVANLVENAHRHGPEGGRVRVAVGVGAGRARLTVRDQGPGVPPEDRERAFERFWQRPGSGGSGLGLAIVRQVAERHGGRAFAGDDGVTVELPLDRAPA
jgi:signal transduction histidine kinase/CheY-like chemotaxis protein